MLTGGVNSAKQRGKGAPKKKRTKEGKESTHEHGAVNVLLMYLLAESKKFSKGKKRVVPAA